MIDANNVNYFNAMYVVGHSAIRICLNHSERFGTMRSAKNFTDEEKSAYVDELLERRAKRDATRAARALEEYANQQTKRSAGKDH